jgi:hypothetical protein
LLSNSRAMQALWIFILSPPTPSAPNAVTPSRRRRVGDLDTLDAERWNRVEIRRGTHRAAPGPCLSRNELYTRGPVLSSSSAPASTDAALALSLSTA